MKSDSNKSEREIVLDLLTERERTGKYSNLLIKNTLDRHANLPLAQRSFIKRLTEGTIERQIELDDILRRHLKRPESADKMKMTVKCLLRMSIYQIYYMDSVPDFAAVNEAIRILRRRHLDRQSGFVNGVLRSVCREKDANEKGEGVDRTHTPLGIKYSMPEDIVGLWINMYGEEETEKLLEAMLRVKPVTIRMNAARPEKEREEVLEKLKENGVDIKAGRWLPYCYELEHVTGIADLPGFREGTFTVQDESSMMAAEAMGLKGTETVIDLCAAPGGKSLHAASLVPEGKVLSFDLSRTKTKRIEENRRRLKLTNVSVAEHDATMYDTALEEAGDVVLCDLPCSGLGVMTKKRDIKYNVTPEKIRSLVTLQKKILRNAVRYVKPGGVLIYSTCTIDRAENEKIAAFIQKELGLKPDDLAPHLPENLPGIEKNMVQLLPHVHGTDGFFIARFVKE